MDCSTPGLPVHHHLLEVAQTLSVESVMTSNHLILLPPSPALNLSQHQGRFQWVSFSHEVIKKCQIFKWFSFCTPVSSKPGLEWLCPQCTELRSLYQHKAPCLLSLLVFWKPFQGFSVWASFLCWAESSRVFAPVIALLQRKPLGVHSLFFSHQHS